MGGIGDVLLILVVVILCVHLAGVCQARPLRFVPFSVFMLCLNKKYLSVSPSGRGPMMFPLRGGSEAGAASPRSWSLWVTCQRKVSEADLSRKLAEVVDLSPR